MGRIPEFYGIAQPSILASYDYTDLTTGIAYKDFYGTKYQDGTFGFTSIPAVTQAIQTSPTINGTPVSALQVFDFDLDFERPQQVQGPVLVAISYFARNRTGASSFVRAYIKVRIYHVDSSDVETEIGTQVTSAREVDAGASTNVELQESLFKYDITRRFKEGEKMRVNIELWGSQSDTSTNALGGICHDPFGRAYNETTTTGTVVQFFKNTAKTELRLSVPFKVVI